MEEKDIVAQGVENQGVAAPETDNVEAENSSATAKSDRNAYFADMRRKQQLDKARQDNQRLKQHLDTAHRAMEILSAIEKEDFSADFQPKSQPDTDNFSDVENFSAPDTVAENELSLAHSQLEHYREKEIQRMMDADLSDVQSVDPTITSMADLPSVFFALRFNTTAPLGAKEAYLAAKTILGQTKQPKPASAGSVADSSGGESEFYTSEQLDSLTPKMLKDQKIMDKALRSMSRLKKERG